MIQMKKISLLVILLSSTSAAYAADYFVAPSGRGGSNDNPGSKEQPWRTIAYASQKLNPGDTLYIRAGEYSERLTPPKSGEPAAPIVYSAYYTLDNKGKKQYEDVRFRLALQSADPSKEIVLIENKKYVVIQGFNLLFLPGTKTGPMAHIRINGGGTNIVQDCTISRKLDLDNFTYTTRRDEGISIQASNGNKIRNNKINGMGGPGIGLGSSSKFTHIHHNDISGNYSNSITIANSKYTLQGTLIEDNLLGDSYASDGVQTQTNFDLPEDQWSTDTGNRGIIIRRNIIRNNGENGIDLKSAGQVVVEQNLIYGTRGDDDGASGSDGVETKAFGSISLGTNRSSKHVIVRNNVLYDGQGIRPNSSTDWMIYNNTIVNNRRNELGPNQGTNTTFGGIEGGGSDNVAMNNIVGDHIYEFNLGGGKDTAGNVYFNTFQTPVYDKDPNGQVVADPSGLFANVPAQPTGEYLDENGFPRFDFTVMTPVKTTDGTEAQGKPLTEAMGMGSNTRTLHVKDARFFYDGYGITEGDLIQIGNKQDSAPVRVVNVDYGANTLTLESSRSWSDKAPVSLAINVDTPLGASLPTSWGLATMTSEIPGTKAPTSVCCIAIKVE